MTSETEIPVVQEPKICAECKHLIGVRHRSEDSKEWKCGHPKNVMRERLDFVTGITHKSFAVIDIYVIRSGHLHCGEAGEWYEEYVPPESILIPVPVKVEKKSLAEDL